MNIAEALVQHHVAVASDRAWQARLRLMQALWREERALPIGHYTPRGGPRKGEPTELGSRLAMPQAEQNLTNYLSLSAKHWVRAEVEAARAGQSDKLYGYPRIFEDLLSSQPLCFNLFAPLADDLALASRVGRVLWPGRVDEVTGIAFEWSPGRGDSRWLANRSAFDVYIRHSTPEGGAGFVGIEVKYHEPLTGKPAAMEGRPYRQVAHDSGVFVDPGAEELARLPLQQVWLDHLLALSMLREGSFGSSALFVFLYPSLNEACRAVVGRYRAQLRDERSFQPLLLEDVTAAIRAEAPGPWIADLVDRYLAYDKLDDFAA